MTNDVPKGSGDPREMAGRQKNRDRSDSDEPKAYQKPSFKPGDILAERYKVVRFISGGGMGEVYEVEDLHLGVHVALKTIRQAIATRSRSRERFRREILLARRISHPNICRIYDLGVHKSNDVEVSFLTMELLSGDTLLTRIGRRGRLCEKEASVIVVQLASALDAAHQAGVLHRDLKSSNVILVPAKDRERAVITDFGLARGFSAEGEDLSRMTADGHVVGTVSYMAPEQMKGGDLGPTSDIYSLGIIMYEMMTGTLPFTGETPLQVVAKRMAQEPEPPRRIIPELDPKWEVAILRCLLRDPAARFANGTELVRTLELPSASDLLALSFEETGSGSKGFLLGETSPAAWGPSASVFFISIPGATGDVSPLSGCRYLSVLCDVSHRPFMIRVSSGLHARYIASAPLVIFSGSKLPSTGMIQTS
ncbi:serine/threonine-protein kinase [Acidobacteriota bacterium]